MKKLLSATLLSIAASNVFAAAASLSHTDMGFHMGIAPGYTSVDHRGVTVYVGHQGIAYHDDFHLGAEVQLTSFGRAPVLRQPGGTSYADISSLSLSAIGSYDLGRFQVFGKIGVADITTFPNVYSAKPKEEVFEVFGPSIGVGAAFKFSEHFAARTEWHQDFTTGQQNFDRGSGFCNPGIFSIGLECLF